MMVIMALMMILTRYNLVSVKVISFYLLCCIFFMLHFYSTTKDSVEYIILRDMVKFLNSVLRDLMWHSKISCSFLFLSVYFLENFKFAIGE